MLLKSADSKDAHIAELERLLKAATGDKKTWIEKELRITKAGVKGEQEAAYLIDFEYKSSENVIVLHDLRFEVAGRVAQIDHLLINRYLECFVLETKHFNSGVKITETGEFMRWNDYKKTYEGMPSPLAQNERHIAVLKDIFGEVKLPTRLGFKLTPTYYSYVLVSPHARIDRPTKFDTSRVIKADALRPAIKAQVANESLFVGLSSVAKTIDIGGLVVIGRQLVALHRPLEVDLSARFGTGVPPSSPPASPAPAAVAAPPAVVATPAPVAIALPPAASSAPAAMPITGPACKACQGATGTIQYGKYGYYFKCGACAANTSVRGTCSQPGHEARLRKEGNRFFEECAGCQSSRLYFENAAGAVAT